MTNRSYFLFMFGGFVMVCIGVFAVLDNKAIVGTVLIVVGSVIVGEVLWSKK